MKNKLYSILILVLSFTAIGVAQDFVRFGAKAGFNAAKLGGDAIYSYDIKPGFHLGAALEIPVTKAFYVQPEALISLQGSGGYFQDDLNLWYFNVPVMVKFNVFDEIYIEAGPQLGLMLSDNLEGNSFAGTPGIDQESNGIDIGLGVGAGYRLDDNLYFQLRFNAGIVNAIKDISSKNRVFQISAIYFL